MGTGEQRWPGDCGRSLATADTPPLPGVLAPPPRLTTQPTGWKPAGQNPLSERVRPSRRGTTATRAAREETVLEPKGTARRSTYRASATNIRDRGLLPLDSSRYFACSSQRHKHGGRRHRLRRGWSALRAGSSDCWQPPIAHASPRLQLGVGPRRQVLTGSSPPRSAPSRTTDPTRWRDVQARGAGTTGSPRLHSLHPRRCRRPAGPATTADTTGSQRLFPAPLLFRLQRAAT